MAQPRQKLPVVNVESETTRKKQLLKQPRNQFFLALKTEEEDVNGKYQTKILRFDLDPFENPIEILPRLSRLLRVDTKKDSGVYISERFHIIFNNEQQIIDMKNHLHHHDIYGAVLILRQLNPENNLSIQKVI